MSMKSSAAWRAPGRLVRTRARKVCLAVAFLVVLPLGCVAVSVLGEECPRPVSDGSAVVRAGTYEGPHGMRIVLSPPGKDGKSAAAVERWPVDLDDLDADGEAPQRRFDGTGTWSDEPVDGGDGRRVRLGLKGGGLWDDSPSRAQYLAVGGTSSAPLLLAQGDPDGCADAVLERVGGG
ncbi:hypothetical protein AB0M39_24040 [Streptomyces sp. NPDC051907]|uniref:hypothetical protein n=1 Tax=Streptomyces sp. NPDC051907 TaxID=3155284 RepID=UPI00341818D4